MLAFLGFVLFLVVTCYLMMVISMSRRPKPKPIVHDSGGFAYVFVVPCLNEERVIADTLKSLLTLDKGRWIVIVVDDGSDDNTADVVSSIDDSRVLLHRRRRPDARKGKGAALNAAMRFMVGSGGDRDPSKIIVCVVDADCRIAANALQVADQYFADAKVGALQVLVRIINRRSSLLARCQDVEFVGFSSIVQTARERLGSVGLGGNGQFTRLSALNELGDAPWSDCLTEDLDLGLRIAINGWSIRYTSETWVEQQGVTKISRLVRQRTRWIHGHMQCLRYVPALWKSDLPNRTVLDLSYYLLQPAILLLASVLYTLPWLFLVQALTGGGRFLGHDREPLYLAAVLGGWYILAFGPSIALGHFYSKGAGDYGRWRSILLLHGMVLYNGFWYLAGWKALARLVLRKRAWAKTERATPEDLTTGPR
jgi:1,2-diacylglycerol 3-beta-glucosyltransferase